MGERASSREGEGAAPRALSPPGKAGGDVTGNPRLKPRGRALPRQGSYPSRQDLRSRPEAPLTGTLLRPPPFTACAGRRGTRAPPAFGASNRRARARGRGGRKGAAREAAAGAAGIPPGPIGRRPGGNGGGRDLPGPVPARICRRSCRENRRQTAGEGGGSARRRAARHSPRPTPAKGDEGRGNLPLAATFRPLPVRSPVTARKTPAGPTRPPLAAQRVPAWHVTAAGHVEGAAHSRGGGARGGRGRGTRPPTHLTSPSPAGDLGRQPDAFFERHLASPMSKPATRGRAVTKGRWRAVIGLRLGASRRARVGAGL